MAGQDIDTSSIPPLDPRNDITGQIAALNELSLSGLRSEWRRLYRSQAPRLSRDLMVRAISYRIQERIHGGLSSASKRILKTYALESKRSGQITPDPRSKARPGTRLIREWNGRTYTVSVTDEGFEYRGQLYGSLSKVAREITGSHWSGPRFFGLADQKASKVTEAADG